MEYLTTQDWVPVCGWTDGRIEGAIKKGKTWLIPANSKKPSDKRFKHPKSENTTSFLQNTSKETV